MKDSIPKKRSQGALEYLIIISAVMVIVSLTVIFVTGAFGTREKEFLTNDCKSAAAECESELLVAPGAECPYCEEPCGELEERWPEEFPNAVQHCKEGNPEKIGAEPGELEDYTLTIEVEGQGTTSPVEGTYTREQGSSVTLSAESDEGWIFGGWTGDLETEERETTVVMTGDKTVTAEFQEQPPGEHKLSVDIEGEGSTNPTGETTYQEGEEVTVEAIEDVAGWEFSEWTGDCTGTTCILTMDSDKSVTANFEEDVDEPDLEEYTLTIEADEGGTTDPTEGTYTYEEEEFVTLSAESDEGWIFGGWTGDLESGDREITVTMRDDYTIRARFREEEGDHTLSIDIEGEGSTYPEGETEYEEGEEVMITATPDEGWYFEEWTGDYEGTSDAISITMDSDKDLTAHFTEEEIEPVTDNGTNLILYLAILGIAAALVVIYFWRKKQGKPDQKAITNLFKKNKQK